MNSCPLPTRLRPRPAAGIATLTIVMVLFFIMAMVAAYANRNLIFEQRISVNNYRSSSAQDMAEAAIDWTVAMLNAGLINASCAPDTGAADDFRARYLSTADDGSYSLRTWVSGTKSVALTSACAVDNSSGAWTCSCPNASATTLAVDSTARAFRVALAATSQPGTIQLNARGCSNHGSGSSSCSLATGTPTVESLASLSVTLGLARALPVAPVAALTVGGALTQASSAALNVSNADANTGIAVHTGQAITAAPSLVVAGPAGTTSNARVDADGSLLTLATAGQLFNSVFGMDTTTYQLQPAAVRLDCSSGCTSSQVSEAAAANPRRVIWASGNVTLDSAATLGSAAVPVMLVVNGDLNITAAQTVYGFVYARNVTTAAGLALYGALVAAGDYSGSAATTISYDAAMLKIITLGYGSFVRVPGSWRMLS